MLDKLFKLFSKERDTLVFQISEEFIEVTALRQDQEEAERLGDDCVTDTLYTKREPIIKPSSKQVLDELAQQVRALADYAVTSPELTAHNFNTGGAKVVCVLVFPLSYNAKVVYKAESPKPLKITKRLLKSILVDDKILESSLSGVPEGYAVYADRLTQVELNGYKTHRPLGRYAKEIYLTVEKYLVDPKLWGAVGSVLESVFNRDIKYMHVSKVEDVSATPFCNKIYTVNELQIISNDIL